MCIASKFLIRNTLNDKGEVPSKDCMIQHSPDIICYQNYVLTYRVACETYPEMMAKPWIRRVYNSIYVRGKNNTGKTQNGEVKLFYTPLNFLYTPSCWTSVATAGGKAIVELRQEGREEAEAGAIVLCSEPFCWSGETSTNCHCFIAVARSKEEEWLHLPDSFGDDPGLWHFLREHPEIAYCDII